MGREIWDRKEEFQEGYKEGRWVWSPWSMTAMVYTCDGFLEAGMLSSMVPTTRHGYWLATTFERGELGVRTDSSLNRKSCLLLDHMTNVNACQRKVLPIRHFWEQLLTKFKTLISSYIRFYSIDSLIVAVKPKPPPKHVRDGFEDEDDDDNLVSIEVVVLFARPSISML